MNLLSLLLIFALFMLPSLFLMRAQRKRAHQVEAMRSSLVPGERIITVSGLHGVVVARREDGAIDVEVAPGVVVAMELAGVMKKHEEAMP